MGLNRTDATHECQLVDSVSDPVWPIIRKKPAAEARRLKLFRETKLSTGDRLAFEWLSLGSDSPTGDLNANSQRLVT